MCIILNHILNIHAYIYKHRHVYKVRDTHSHKHTFTETHPHIHAYMHEMLACSPPAYRPLSLTCTSLMLGKVKTSQGQIKLLQFGPVDIRMFYQLTKSLIEYCFFHLTPKSSCKTYLVPCKTGAFFNTVCGWWLVCFFGVYFFPPTASAAIAWWMKIKIEQTFLWQTVPLYTVRMKQFEDYSLYYWTSV